MGTVGQLTPAEFLARWPAFQEGPVTLLDVREPHEHEVASVDGSVDIPMAEVPARIAELDRDKPIVVMCHGGNRSMKVAQFLAGQGFKKVFNMTGGIEAWAATPGNSGPDATTGRH